MVVTQTTPTLEPREAQRPSERVEEERGETERLRQEQLDKEQLRKDRIAGVLVLAALVVLFALMWWLASLGGTPEAPERPAIPSPPYW